MKRKLYRLFDAHISRNDKSQKSQSVNHLIVFDSFIDLNRIDSIRIPSSQEDRILLFPLTSNTEKIKELKNKINGNREDHKEETIQTAKLINETADKLRIKYIEFISNLSNVKLKNGQKIREYFSIDNLISSWWFSSVAEKNTLKVNSFQKLVQMDAICQVVERENIKKIYFGCKSKKLKKTLGCYAKRNLIDFDDLPVKDKTEIKEGIREFQQFLYIKHCIHAVLCSLYFFIRTWRIRKKFGRLKRKSPKDDIIMIVTYYPNIDIPSANRGLFKNIYYPGLQEAMKYRDKDILWVYIYVDNNSISFKQSLEYAEQFIKNGENIYFFEEFVSYLSIPKTLLVMILTGLKFMMIEREIASLHAFETYKFYEIFKEDWYSSFVGYAGFVGLLFYNSFKRMLRKNKTKKILYYCEMHAWEKALISANNFTGNKIKLFAYQHATVPWMLLNYFNSPNEINDISRYSMPKPDMIICNGELTYQYMRDCSWPESKLSIAEAIRFAYLKKYLYEFKNKSRAVLLVVLSTNTEANINLLKMSNEAVKNIKDLEVWVKPHPFLNIKDINKVIVNECMQDVFQIKTDSIEQLLREVKIIVIDESSVAIEALALGCAVIITNMPEGINMSPLRNIKANIIRAVDSAEELNATITELLKVNMLDHRAWQTEANKIVHNFFCLNYDSEIPEKFIQILENQSLQCGCENN